MENENIKVEEFLNNLLNFTKPWEIEKVEQEKEKGRVVIYLGYQKGTKFRCPECGAECSVYDSKYREIRHLDLWQYKTYIKAKVPRIKCTCNLKKKQCPYHSVEPIVTLH
jgi:transposase